MLFLQFTGILSEEITARGLSNLNWTADGTAQVYCHLALSVSNLYTVSKKFPDPCDNFK